MSSSTLARGRPSGDLWFAWFIMRRCDDEPQGGERHAWPALCLPFGVPNDSPLPSMAVYSGGHEIAGTCAIASSKSCASAATIFDPHGRTRGPAQPRDGRLDHATSDRVGHGGG